VVAVTVGAEPAGQSAAAETTTARAVAVESLAMAVRVNVRGLLRANHMRVGMPDQLPVVDGHMT
jgi:hypothetical protein